MVADFKTIVWKELRESILQYGSVKKWILNMSLIVVTIGVFLPLQFGTMLVESIVILLWVWMPMFLVLNIISDSIAGERERHTLETLLASRLSDEAILLGKMVVPIFQAWVMVQISALFALITINITANEGRLIIYPLPVVIGIIIIPVMVGLLLAEIGVLASVHATTVRQAYQRMIIPFLAMFIIPSILMSILPKHILSQLYSREFAENQMGGVLLVLFIMLIILDVLLMMFIFKRFHRSQLVTD